MLVEAGLFRGDNQRERHGRRKPEHHGRFEGREVAQKPSIGSKKCARGEANGEGVFVGVHRGYLVAIASALRLLVP
jgi:hypothetical protein